MTSILDLKNPKNRKVNNNHSVRDVLNGDSESPELEPVPIAPTKKEKRLDEFLENLDRIDIKEEILDNSGIMPESTMFPATFAGLSWTAPDKHHELISHAWRKGIITILVAMAFTALLWQGSILTAITFFALAVVTSMHFWQEARHERYEIHPHGIVVAGQFHHYHDLDSFWIHEHPEGFHELSLCTGQLINHYIKISLKGQDPLEVRDVLLRYLPEERHEEGLEDLLRRKLGL